MIEIGRSCGLPGWRRRGQIQLFIFRVRENFENRRMWHQAAVYLGCGFMMSPCLRGRVASIQKTKETSILPND
jgi:hypothetical protein